MEQDKSRIKARNPLPTLQTDHADLVFSKVVKSKVEEIQTKKS